ncbi:MAG: hypothetical protein KTR16_04865 [Acidiferrobacterales bacterium]|nr:hypothetical protein [Acidiferrobacterales bacterium]
MALENQSLRRRLLVSAALLLLVFLGIMGLGLNSAFKESVLSNAEDALRNQIVLLLSNVDVVENRLMVANELLEARLLQADSDLFAQISSDANGILWTSESSLGLEMPVLLGSLGEFRFYPQFQWPDRPKMYAMSLNVEWETEQGDLPFTIQIAEKTLAYDQRLRDYRKQISLWLSVMGVSLLALLLALLSWALKPLVRVTQQVSEIEQGERKRFDEDYPAEVSRLTQNLNQLLNVEEQRISRQKQVLGNLAHSLKTPVAVLKGIKYSPESKDDVENQLDTIQNIIDYQLQSASAVGRRRFAQPISVFDDTYKILNSLNKLYADKAIKPHVEIPQNIQFFGDQGDWMELCGNLLENAFKWAESEVQITVENHSAPELGSRKGVVLKVSDDGPGIKQERKSEILQRGVRLDRQTPGHGLGLNIVKNIVEAYEGKISIDDNEPKGTIFTVLLT